MGLNYPKVCKIRVNFRCAECEREDNVAHVAASENKCAHVQCYLKRVGELVAAHFPEECE